MESVGLRKSRVEFEDLMYQTLKESDVGESTEVQLNFRTRTDLIYRGFCWDDQSFTGGAFDIEIQGRGFFALESPDGQRVYTRNGAFKRGPTGRMENPYPLLPEIVILPQTHSVQIDLFGVVSYISSEKEIPREIGQIELVDFENPVGLKIIGPYLYVSSLESGSPKTGFPGRGTLGVLVQGQLGHPANMIDEIAGLRIP